MKVDNNYIQQAVVAREIIDLYRNSPDKYEVAESLSSLCFAMARLTNCDKVDYPAIDWDDLASNFDGIATSQDSDVSSLRKIKKRHRVRIQKVFKNYRSIAKLN